MNDATWVLVADDNAGIRESVVEILLCAGYQVTEADDGDVALQRFTEHPTEIMVLDVRMPRCDGIALIENLIPSPPPPAILLVSAYDVDPEVKARLGRKVFKYLRKPVSPLDLLAAVAEASGIGNAVRA
jgi:CheY-like chemotaxis protein